MAGCEGESVLLWPDLLHQDGTFVFHWCSDGCWRPLFLRTALRWTIVPSAVQPCAGGPRWAQFWGEIHTPHSLWVQPAGRPQVQVTSLLSCFLSLLSYFLCILSSGSVSLIRHVHPHSFSGSQMTQVKAELHRHYSQQPGRPVSTNGGTNKEDAA